MKSLPCFTIVDRYFMRKYLFVASALLFIGGSIFMIFDVLSKVDEVNTLFHSSPWEALKTIFQFYTVRMMNLLLYTQFAFIMTITAITFFMLEKNSSATVRGGEVIPMLTSGFSRKRVAAPFFIIGCVFILVLCITEELFYVYCRDWPGAVSDSFTGKIDKQAMDMRNDDSTGLKIYGENLDLETGTFQNVKIGVPKSKTLNQLDEIQAASASWLPECDDHPAGYMLEKVENLEKKTWLSQAAQTPFWLPHLETELPVFYTSQTCNWVSPGNLFVVAMLSPDRLSKKKMGFLPRSIPDLYREIHVSRQIDANYADRVALHCRIIRPLVDCILLFMLIPVILSARLRSKVVIFFCLAGLTGLNIGLVEFGKMLVIYDELPPTIGAWIPVLFLAPLSAILFDELYT